MQSAITPSSPGDEIDRAMQRNAVNHGSRLEADIRANAYFILGVGATDRDKKLDVFIAQQRGDPKYADSFMPQRVPAAGTRRVARADVTTPRTPSREVFEAIAAGKATVE
jgi:hypothetical protein